MKTITQVVQLIKSYIDKGDGKRLAAQTLSAGSTTLTFSDNSITNNSTIIPRVSKWGVAPTNIVITTGQAVLTFDEQDSAISVYLVIQ